MTPRSERFCLVSGFRLRVAGTLALFSLRDVLRLRSALDHRMVAVALAWLFVPAVSGCLGCTGHEPCDYTPYWLYDSPAPHVIASATVEPDNGGSPEVADALVGGTIELTEDEVLIVRWSQGGVEWVLAADVSNTKWVDDSSRGAS